VGRDGESTKGKGGLSLPHQRGRWRGKEPEEGGLGGRGSEIWIDSMKEEEKLDTHYCEPTTSVPSGKLLKAISKRSESKISNALVPC
jgi:GTPase involved in cell partitioning and DNA repair